jgi:hypothetical protein
MTQNGGPPSLLEKNDQSEQDLPDDVKICLMTYASKAVPYHFEKPGAAKLVIKSKQQL